MTRKARLYRNSIIAVVISAIALYELGAWVIGMTKRVMIEQRYGTLKELLDTRCVEADTMAIDDWEEAYDYHVRRLSVYFSEMDNHHMVFSAVYDSELNLLSERNPRFPGQPFNPLDYPEVVIMFNTSHMGETVVPFTYIDDKGNVQPCPLKLYFRRVPSNEKDKFVIVTIAQDTIEGDVNLPDEFWGVFVIVFSVAILSVACLILIFTRYLHLRYVFVFKEGDEKWTM